MTQKAKLFMSGGSQAVRLPAKYRFDCDTVFINKYPETGNIIISKQSNNWSEFFNMLEQANVPDNFLADKDVCQPEERNVFE